MKLVEFNNIILYFEIIAILSCYIWYLFLYKRNKSNARIVIGNFSGENKNIEGYKEFKELLIRRYMIQQVWSFGLLWFSIAISLILGSVIILKIINREFDQSMLADGIGLGGGIGISVSSFRLYRITSQKIEKLLLDK